MFKFFPDDNFSNFQLNNVVTKLNIETNEAEKSSYNESRDLSITNFSYFSEGKGKVFNLSNNIVEIDNDIDFEVVKSSNNNYLLKLKFLKNQLISATSLSVNLFLLLNGFSAKFQRDFILNNTTLYYETTFITSDIFKEFTFTFSYNDAQGKKQIRHFFVGFEEKTDERHTFENGTAILPLEKEGYKLKYYSFFKETGLGIFDKNYIGSPIEIKEISNFLLEKKEERRIYHQEISFTFKTNHQLFYRFLNITETSHFVQVENLNNTIFTGYLTPNLYEEPFVDGSYFMTLRANSGLKNLTNMFTGVFDMRNMIPEELNPISTTNNNIKILKEKRIIDIIEGYLYLTNSYLYFWKFWNIIRLLTSTTTLIKNLIELKGDSVIVSGGEIRRRKRKKRVFKFAPYNGILHSLERYTLYNSINFHDERNRNFILTIAKGEELGYNINRDIAHGYSDAIKNENGYFEFGARPFSVKFQFYNLNPITLSTRDVIKIEIDIASQLTDEVYTAFKDAGNYITLYTHLNELTSLNNNLKFFEEDKRREISLGIPVFLYTDFGTIYGHTEFNNLSNYETILTTLSNDATFSTNRNKVINNRKSFVDAYNLWKNDTFPFEEVVFKNVRNTLISYFSALKNILGEKSKDEFNIKYRPSISLSFAGKDLRPTEKESLNLKGYVLDEQTTEVVAEFMRTNKTLTLEIEKGRTHIFRNLPKTEFKEKGFFELILDNLHPIGIDFSLITIDDEWFNLGRQVNKNRLNENLYMLLESSNTIAGTNSKYGIASVKLTINETDVGEILPSRQILIRTDNSGNRRITIFNHSLIDYEKEYKIHQTSIYVNNTYKIRYITAKFDKTFGIKPIPNLPRTIFDFKFLMNKLDIRILPNGSDSKELTYYNNSEIVEEEVTTLKLIPFHTNNIYTINNEIVNTDNQILYDDEINIDFTNTQIFEQANYSKERLELNLTLLEKHIDKTDVGYFYPNNQIIIYMEKFNSYFKINKYRKDFLRQQIKVELVEIV